MGFAAGCGDKCFFKTPKVGSKGPEDSPFVIVGESPGALEMAWKTPFVGNSGKVIHEVLAKCGISFEPDSDLQPFFTNAVQCLPQAKDEERLKAACGCCHQRLMDEIKAYPRRVILALGAGALWSLTDNYSLKITPNRGKLISSPLAECGIVVAYHPAFLLRGKGNYPQFVQDVQYAVNLARHGSKAKKLPNGSMYWIAETPEDVQRVVQEIQHESVEIIAADIETSHLHHRKGRILCIGMQYKPGEVVVIPGHLIVDELFRSDARYVWHNGKFDIRWLRSHGAPSAVVDEDTMMMSYALNERRGIHDLDQVASDWLGAADHKHMLDQYLPNKKTSYEVIPKEVLYHYTALDLSKTYGLYYALRPKVAKDQHSRKLYTKVLIPASEYLAKVELKGIRVDLEWNASLQERMAAEREGYKNEINKVAQQTMGHEINPNSHVQLKNLLYKTLKLGPETASTDEDTLDKLPAHPAVVNLLKYRKVNKGLSTYVLSIPKHMAETAPDSGVFKIHTTYLLHGTATGRLSSRDPNLQNQPRDPWLRGQYISDEGYVFLEPDLSQAELRSLATLSGDDELIAIFSSTNRSLHDEVATEFFGAGFDEEQKMIAKNVNFGIVYGITNMGLFLQLDSNGIKTSLQECQRYIDAWYRRFPKAAAYIEACRNSVIEGTTIITTFGRKKRHGVTSREKLKDLMNEASNFPHQSIASDITLETGCHINQDIEALGAWVSNTVHDSILVNCPMDVERINQVGSMLINGLQETPKRWGLTTVPFKAEIKVGMRWGSAKAAKKAGCPANDFLVEWVPGTPLPQFILDRIDSKAKEAA